MTQLFHKKSHGKNKCQMQPMIGTVNTWHLLKKQPKLLLDQQDGLQLELNLWASEELLTSSDRKMVNGSIGLKELQRMLECIQTPCFHKNTSSHMTGMCS